MSSIFDWSLTAADNGNADSSINWQEGQDPSTVNNSARAMMMRQAQLLKDIGGTVTAGGTANAITVTSNSPITSYATGQIIGFKASATNTAATTLNVNGIGAKSIRKSVAAFDAALSGDEIIDDAVYICIYDAALNSAAGGWLLLNPSLKDLYDDVASLQSNALPGHIYGLALSNNATDATNDIDIATGSAASDAASPTMMTLASALTKRIDSNWAVGTNQGGLDTGSVADGTYWIWLIQRSDTGVVDALFSASATAPTMPTNYDRKRRIAPIIRASGAILAFSYNSYSKYWEYSGSSTDTSTISTSPVLRTVKVPVGVPVMARFGVAVSNTSSGLMSIVNHWNPALGATLPNGRSGVGHVFVNTNTSQSMQYDFDTVTNSSAQIYNLATTTGGSTLTAYTLTTLGYFFTPGS